MSDEVYQKLLELSARREPYALATVIAVHGSASARPGSKAIISFEGRNILGWIGGGCAESYVAQQALEAMQIAQPRVIHIDLNDEVLGVGMPCGGSMDVFVEPVTPGRQLFLFGDDIVIDLLAKWMPRCGFDIHRNSINSVESCDLVVRRSNDSNDPGIGSDHPGMIATGLSIHPRTPAEEAVSLAARLLMIERQSTGEPLWRSNVMHTTPRASVTRIEPRPQIVLVGHNRITESLADLAVAMDWQVTVNGPGSCNGEYPQPVCRVLDDDAYELNEVTSNSYVVIATQHKGDHRILRSVLRRNPAYVGLIASRRRADLILDFLEREGLMQSAKASLQTPCGLDLGARSPFEIALSITSEIIARRNMMTCI